MDEYYEIFKSIHIIAIISWMAGMLYLPRIFYYHTKVEFNSESDLIFRKMERRLLRIIMNPAMIMSLVSGFILAEIYGFSALGPWFHVKITCVILMIAVHGFFAKIRKNFDVGVNERSGKFFKIVNEVPTILLIIIVFMVILKPFE